MYRINKKKCIGCGTCVAVSNGAIELGKDGKAEIKNQEKLKTQTDLPDFCPVQAIEIKNNEVGKS